MNVFRLEPIEGAQGSHHWEASTLAPITVWVEAEDEIGAREILNSATIIATIKRRGREMPMAPWKDFGLVRCSPDSSKKIAKGTILTADGRVLVIEDQ